MIGDGAIGDAAICMCGGEIVVVDLPADLARYHGKRTLWVHADGDDRCYPESADQSCKATPERGLPSVARCDTPMCDAQRGTCFQPTCRCRCHVQRSNPNSVDTSGYPQGGAE